jgi:hypothetical protein
VELGGDEEKELPVMQALAEYRAERITGTEYSYDFSEAVAEYPLDEYIVGLDLSDFEEGDDEAEDSYDDQDPI